MTSSLPYPVVDATAKAVNWDAILHTVRAKVGAATAGWGQQKSGGFNLIRFLHLDDDEVVVRLPLYPDPERTGPITPAIMEQNVRKTASMLASMEYVAAHSTIPVPRIIYSCLDPDLDNVRSPYVVMSKVEGKALSNFWHDMPDTQRNIVLEQVIDILLQLSTLRFDKIGSLFKADNGSWCIEPSPEATYVRGTDQYLAIADARLRKIKDGRFGYICNVDDYVHHWFMRSLIPSLYDNSLDAKGFPLMHGDFHSQNILVVDADTHPRITAIIDWDDTTTRCTSSFAQYPLFIVDHPVWLEDDHPLRPRNVRDQPSFNRLLEKAEREKFPDAAPVLSRAFANCQRIYLFEQCIRDEYMYSCLFKQLVRHAFGPDTLWSRYVDDLENGILEDVVEKLQEEIDVADEAREVLNGKVNVDGLSREEFIKVAREHKDLFAEGKEVESWLNKVIEEL